MAGVNRGTKRTCLDCSSKFYDLERDPILCPKCGTVFELEKITKIFEEKKEEEDDTEIDIEPAADAAGAEFISLEEAQEDEADEEIPDMDDIDDVDDSVGQNEDVFLEEDETGSDVSDLIVPVDNEDQG